MPSDAVSEDLLVPVLRNGGLVYHRPLLSDIRERTQTQLALFHPGIKRLDNPHEYPVGLEHGLHERKTALILGARERQTANRAH
jgi:nicotinate phosphoribosyltransferase